MPGSLKPEEFVSAVGLHSGRPVATHNLKQEAVSCSLDPPPLCDLFEYVRVLVPSPPPITSPCISSACHAGDAGRAGIVVDLDFDQSNTSM